MKRSLKDAAKKGDKDVLKILAKEIVHSHKAISKIHAAKAQLKSVEYSMQQQLGRLDLMFVFWHYLVFIFSMLSCNIV